MIRCWLGNEVPELPTAEAVIAARTILDAIDAAKINDSIRIFVMAMMKDKVEAEADDGRLNDK